MKQAKFMQSKFDSACCDCRAPINKGETIYYIGKGRAQCQNCAPRIAEAPAAESKDWSSALAWKAAPAPGESITQTAKPASVSIPPSNPRRSDTRTAEIAAEAKSADVIDLPQPVKIERDNPPVMDDSVAIIRDMLVLLVNAIDNANRDQRRALDSLARDMMTNASTIPRSRIWAALADVINA